MIEKSQAQSSFWLRLLQHPAFRLLGLGLIIFLMMAVTGGFMERLKGNPLQSIGVVVAMTTAAIAIYVVWARLIERRSASELSLSGAGKELGAGLLVGAGLYTASVLILIALGVYRIEGLNHWTFVIPAVAMALSSGLFEELLFRGVLFRSMSDMFGDWIALVVLPCP